MSAPMKPITQTILGSPYGNCMAACLATITDIPLRDFPVNLGDGRFLAALNLFMGERGYSLKHGTLAEGKKMKGLHLGRGVSPRGYNHSCVYKDGELFFDPHPSHVGLARLDKFLFVLPR